MRKNWKDVWSPGTWILISVLSETYPMNNSKTGFKWFSKIFASLCYYRDFMVELFAKTSMAHHLLMTCLLVSGKRASIIAKSCPRPAHIHLQISTTAPLFFVTIILSYATKFCLPVQIKLFPLWRENYVPKEFERQPSVACSSGDRDN